MRKSIIAAVVFVLTVVFSVVGVAQQKTETAPSVNKPLVVKPKEELTSNADSSHTQLLLEKQKTLTAQAQNIRLQTDATMAQMQKQYDDNERAIQAWIADTKKKNNWGDDVSYDRDGDKWYREVKASEKKEEAKPIPKDGVPLGSEVHPKK